MQNSERLREFYYTLISRLLVNEVDKEVVEAIKSDDTLKELFVYCAEEGDYLSKESDKIVEELSSEYVDLFLIKLVPYESFYQTEEAMVNSGTENPTMVFYKQYGFEVEPVAARVVSADHIGLEFEFLANLIRNERDALEDGNDAYAKRAREVQQEFMRRHLIPFALLFLPSLVDAAKTPFYKDAAEIALEFLLTDYEELCSYEHNCDA